MQTAAVAATELDRLDDRTLVERARNQDGAAVRLLMQRHNRRLYRVARSVLNDEAEAEDVVQETYVRAFTHLDGFRGEAQLSTWLTRIALNEALGRLRRRRIMVGLKDIDAISDQGEARVIYLPSARQDTTRKPQPPGPRCGVCSNARWTSCPTHSAWSSCSGTSRR
jgi:RNA polymerase sigma-70 factor, ECF subfamily